jgi:hypothetical protein
MIKSKNLVLIFFFFLSSALGLSGQSQGAGERYIGYHSMQDTYLFIDSIAKAFPDLVFTDTIGFSQWKQNPIIALRISDFPSIDEDEPCIMYDGLHHAREPIGMEACLKLIEHLLSNYGTDDQITTWINETEIWIIPMINPDGWDYCFDKKLDSPYWRKNQRDNNGDGRFLPTIDGVDINRNYDFNWDVGGSGDFNSITYRGPAPFSESEAQAKKYLALREKPLISISYHTHGEIVIFSWSETPRAPDQELLEELATQIAEKIPSVSGTGTYRPSVSDCQNGFSRCWMYAIAGSLEYTVECAREFIPFGNVAQDIAESQIDGAMHILERVHGAGLQVYVKDAITNQVVVARVSVEEIREDLLAPRLTDSLFGRRDRLLIPGNYTLKVEAEGYQTQVINDLIVSSGRKTPVHVFLQPESMSDRDFTLAMDGSKLLVHKVYPNPFNEAFTIEYTLYESSPVRITLVDITGRQMQVIEDQAKLMGRHSMKWETRNSDQDLSSGFYILNIQTNNTSISQKIWMID